MKLNTTTTVLIVLAVVLLGGYWYFSVTASGEPPLTEGTASSEAQVRFQTLASELQSISFNTGIFSDTRFNSLVDLATPVTPESAGRIDPFAPVAGVSNINE